MLPVWAQAADTMHCNQKQVVDSWYLGSNNIVAGVSPNEPQAYTGPKHRKSDPAIMRCRLVSPLRMVQQIWQRGAGFLANPDVDVQVPRQVIPFGVVAHLRAQIPGCDS
jgi:hypothetical protein